jgi:hypothetical protein
MKKTEHLADLPKIKMPVNLLPHLFKAYDSVARVIPKVHLNSSFLPLGPKTGRCVNDSQTDLKKPLLTILLIRRTGIPFANLS